MQGRVHRLLPRQVQHEALQQLQQSQGDLSAGLACPSPAGGTWAPPSPPPWTDLWPRPTPTPATSTLRGRWRHSRRLAPRLPGLSCSLLLPARAAPRAEGAKAASAEGAGPGRAGSTEGTSRSPWGLSLLSPPLPLSTIVPFCEGFSYLVLGQEHN